MQAIGDKLELFASFADIEDAFEPFEEQMTNLDVRIEIEEERETGPSVRKVIRLVREHAGNYPSGYAAVTAVARRLGMTPETLRRWIWQAAVGEGQAARVTTESAREIRGLRRKVSELERTIGIPDGGGEFFRAGVRPAAPLICAFVDAHRDRFGVVPMCRALTGQGGRSPWGRTGRGGPGRRHGGRWRMRPGRGSWPGSTSQAPAGAARRSACMAA